MPIDILNEMPLAELEHWLSDKLGTEKNIIRHIPINHKKVFADVTETPVDKKPGDNRIFISEQEALERIKDLHIPPYSLRRFAFKKRNFSSRF